MSVADDFKAILEANAPLVALLTGGIYSFEETGRMGIGFNSTPSVFDGPQLKPCALVKTRSKTPTLDLRDEANQVMSYRQILQIYLYQEGGYATIESAADLIFTLLHDKTAITGKRTMYADSFEGHQAEELNGASVNRYDYQINAIEGV